MKWMAEEICIESIWRHRRAAAHAGTVPLVGTAAVASERGDLIAAAVDQWHARIAAGRPTGESASDGESYPARASQNGVAHPGALVPHPPQPATGIFSNPNPRRHSDADRSDSESNTQRRPNADAGHDDGELRLQSGQSGDRMAGHLRWHRLELRGLPLQLQVDR